MAIKTNTDKISKQNLLACKYISNITVENGRIEFSVRVMSWKERGDGPQGDLLSISCPDVDMISYKSFFPTHYRDIPVGNWIQKLIDNSQTKEQEPLDIPLSESLMDQALQEFKKVTGDAALDTAFIELAIKALRKET